MRLLYISQPTDQTYCNPVWSTLMVSGHGIGISPSLFKTSLNEICNSEIKCDLSLIANDLPFVFIEIILIFFHI